MLGLIGAGTARAQLPEGLRPPFRWTLSPALLGPEERAADRSVAQKDPSVIFHNNRWHLFMTIKCDGYTIMEHASFDDWSRAHEAKRHVIRMHDKYACAPQVFFHRGHQLWYMVFQKGGYMDRGLKMQVVYSTTRNIEDPASWSEPRLFFPDADPRGAKNWLDFWVICDDREAFLFYTSLNGQMWRLRAPASRFPMGFDDCQLALQADIFEASHTYRVKGMEKYLTIVEAQGVGARRYYKAYLADRLDGKWSPLADTEAAPFAGKVNVRPAPGASPWTDNVSHGELVRDSNDETMTIDPAHLRFVIQGVLEKQKGGKGYGQFPWRIGMLERVIGAE